MISARVRWSHFEKYWLLILEHTEVQTVQISDRLFGVGELISEYLESKF